MPSSRAASLALLLALPVLACGGSGRSGFEEPAPAPGEAGDPAAPAPTGDFDQKPPPKVEEPEIAEVYGHSAKTLYRLDPKTKQVTVIGDFQGCKDIIDIALDESSNLFGAGYDALYRIEKSDASCTEIATGSYPNSLSFVPKGTVDPNEEALVGYDQGDYLRIDTKTGAVTKIGELGSNFRSSGDIVSVKGGKTYLTVKDVGFKGSCTQTDCLVEVDPQTGAVVKNWGSIEHKNVFGLSFWGGKVYGFDDTGNLFEVTFGSKQLATTSIPIPQKPSDLKFWGAGSSTSAPLVATPQ